MDAGHSQRRRHCELVGRAEQHGDLPGPAAGEQRGLAQVGAGVVNEPDLRGGHPGAISPARILPYTWEPFAPGVQVTQTPAGDEPISDLTPRAPRAAHRVR